MHPECGFQINPKRPQFGKIAMTSQFFDMTSSSNFYDVVLFLINFSYWSKFHVSTSLVQELWRISFYKGLTRNPEIGNSPVWVLLNIWRLGQVRNTKFCTNISNKILLNAAKCQGCSFYYFWVIKGKPTGGKITPPTPPNQLPQGYRATVRRQFTFYH